MPPQILKIFRLTRTQHFDRVNSLETDTRHVRWDKKRTQVAIMNYWTRDVFALTED